MGSEWEDRLAEILSELEKPELLYLALLFHDVGKGMEAPDHIEGSLQALDGIMARLDLAAGDRATVRFLIASHLEMSTTLQRRDIFDPETVREFAGKIETSERLKMLSLLTYADIKSVNPEALTPWKTELLWRLYAATANYLARSLDKERVKPVPPLYRRRRRFCPCWRLRRLLKKWIVSLRGSLGDTWLLIRRRRLRCTFSWLGGLARRLSKLT